MRFPAAKIFLPYRRTVQGEILLLDGIAARRALLGTRRGNTCFGLAVFQRYGSLESVCRDAAGRSHGSRHQAGDRVAEVSCLESGRSM